MKCIYCNSEVELTSSDIITYAITGAKLTKSFVCKTHNAFTNDNYEKKYVADLDFFTNHLGLTTRDGKPIQYKADRYVVFDFWKTIAYRVRICKSPNGVIPEIKSFFFELYLYHIDGSKTKTAFGAYPLDGKTKPAFITIKPEDMKIDLWREFMKRIEKIMSTMVLSIYTLKKEVDLISLKLKKYDEGKIDVAQLLGFEENNIVRNKENTPTEWYFGKLEWSSGEADIRQSCLLWQNCLW